MRARRSDDSRCQDQRPGHPNFIYLSAHHRHRLASVVRPKQCRERTELAFQLHIARASVCECVAMSSPNFDGDEGVRVEDPLSTKLPPICTRLNSVTGWSNKKEPHTHTHGERNRWFSVENHAPPCASMRLHRSVNIIISFGDSHACRRTHGGRRRVSFNFP